MADRDNEREDGNLEPYKFQIREWNTKVVSQHLPSTDCDRDNPQAVSNLIVSLQDRVKELEKDLKDLVEDVVNSL